VELKALLRRAGFARVKAHGTLDGASYDQDAQRLVLVGCKN
jgi:hypothetical protein